MALEFIEATGDGDGVPRGLEGPDLFGVGVDLLFFFLELGDGVFFLGDGDLLATLAKISHKNGFSNLFR